MTPEPEQPVVCGDATTAEGALARGADVVLIVAADARVPPGTGGRLALFVGDPADPDDVDAARSMAAELFGRPSPGAAGPSPPPAPPGGLAGRRSGWDAG